MQIENKEEYKDIPTSSLELSTRSFNALMRANLSTLYLLIENKEKLFEIRNIGTKSIDEILGVLEQIAENGITSVSVNNVQEEQTLGEVIDAQVSYSLSDEILNRPSQDLHVSVRIRNSFSREGIKTIREVLSLTPSDIVHLRNMGKMSANQLIEEIELLKAQGDDYFIQPMMNVETDTSQSNEVVAIGKGFDFDVIDILAEQFYMKPICMTEWYGLSRQGMYNALNKRSPKHRDIWTGKEMIEDESAILESLIQNKKFDYFDETVRCCVFNNRQDDLACVFIYENEIKCFFLRDLPDELRELVLAANYQKYMRRELAGETDGHIVYILTKPHFIPEQPDKFRANAQIRGMSLNDYALFISGYPMGDARSVTDKQVTAFFEENMVDGKVYISSDPSNQWIRSLASRNGYSIKDFIELFGYESKLGGTELTTDETKEQHVEALKRYLVQDNVVYFPADSNIYRVLSTYCYNKGFKINEYIRSLGFVRTTERPEVKTDITEKDMQVRNTVSDAEFEDKVFAQYPLLGSGIIKAETLEELNQNARTYIDKVLRQPLTQLTLREEMQITLVLINIAKNWKSEENSKFWNYLTLQLGYRDTSGAVVRLLKSSLENAMKKNNRLFVEDSNGRAFKSTAVIHALSTQKSWMALFDFLFDFYKNNLDWKVIPGDPLLEMMVAGLQKKLVGESEEDAKITISSRVYSFQEGVRKLILFRPVYARSLFEKLIGKIDAMINSEEAPVKTYEEQLCEEWFKMKITAIANTKRTERKKADEQREVAIDYSRIRIKYILKNENNVQLVLPDIRLKREDIQKAMLVIYYNETVAFQQNLSWYGNELGKTLSGTSVTLPEYPDGKDAIRVRIKITCNAETIFDSEDTLNRDILMFAAGSEVNAAQVHHGNYTIVIPRSSYLEAENTDITEIDSFKTPGLTAFFLELHNGYMLTMDGKLIAFDSENETDVRVISPSESAALPRVTTDEAECYLAYRNSFCRIILRDAEYKQQFIVMKNGERIEFSDMEDSGNDLAFVCPLSGENDFCRLQVISLGDERLAFDRSFMLISEAECSFDREFYFTALDYKAALFFAEIDDNYEEVIFTADDDEVSLPFRNGMLHVTIPKVSIQETTGAWMNGQSSAWYIGDIPQNSLLKVNNPAGTSIQFFVGGKDIMYDGQGIVTIGNVIQSLVGAHDLSIAHVEMYVNGAKQEQKYLLTRVCYKESFLKTPEFWFDDEKLFWNQGGTFIGKRDRVFTLTLMGENDASLDFKINAGTEFVDLPNDMPIGNYRFEISVMSESLFKKVKEVLAEGDCVIGDQNLLRFNGRKIIIDAITDEFKEEAGRITITTCFIDQLEFMGVEDTSEGICPVYQGVIYTQGYQGERYEFSFDQHTNKRGVTKMMVNPVRIIYVGENALCITDPEGDGLYYYKYYDKYLEKLVFALTDHEYTKANRHKYSTADLYSYRTERI